MLKCSECQIAEIWCGHYYSVVSCKVAEFEGKIIGEGTGVDDTCQLPPEKALKIARQMRSVAIAKGGYDYKSITAKDNP